MALALMGRFVTLHPGPRYRVHAGRARLLFDRGSGDLEWVAGLDEDVDLDQRDLPVIEAPWNSSIQALRALGHSAAREAVAWEPVDRAVVRMGHEHEREGVTMNGKFGGRADEVLPLIANRNIRNAASWRIGTEICRRYPEETFLLDAIPIVGVDYDSVRVARLDGSGWIEINRNATGSVRRPRVSQ